MTTTQPGNPRIYLVMELYYDLPEDYETQIYDVYHRYPIGAATFVEAAELICREKTVAFIRCEYFEGFNRYAEIPDPLSKQKKAAFITQLSDVGLDKVFGFKRDIKSYSDDELLAICEFLNLKFFVVKDIELFA